MSSGGGGTTTVQKSDPWKKAQPYLEDVMSQAQSLYDSGSGTNYYEGNTYAGLNNTANSALDGIIANASGVDPITSAAQTQAQSTINGDYLDVTQNPAFQNIIDGVTNSVNSQFGAAGRTGSANHASSIAQGITQGAAGLYSTERQLQENAVNNAGQTSQYDLLNSQTMLDAASMQQQDAQGQIDADVNRFNFNENAETNALNNYSGIVNGLGGLGGTTTSTGDSSGGGFGLSDGIGLGLSALSMFSDQRLKHDIEQIGMHKSGVPLYSFKYIGSNQPQTGVMAQELEKVAPYAVSEFCGFKVVDYGMIGGL